MATKQSTVDYILDQVGENVTARKMFGEYALYAKGKVIALVCDDTLFVKITVEGKKFVGTYYEEDAAYPGRNPRCASMKTFLMTASGFPISSASLPNTSPHRRRKRKRKPAADSLAAGHFLGEQLLSRQFGCDPEICFGRQRKHLLLHELRYIQ